MGRGPEVASWAFSGRVEEPCCGAGICAKAGRGAIAQIRKKIGAWISAAIAFENPMRFLVARRICMLRRDTVLEPTRMRAQSLLTQFYCTVASRVGGRGEP